MLARGREAARTAKSLGPATAREYYAELLEVVGDADTDRAGVWEAREFIDRGGSRS